MTQVLDIDDGELPPEDLTPVDPRVLKQREREEIEAQTKAFLERGGQVKNLDPGMQGYEFITKYAQPKKGSPRKFNASVVPACTP